MESSCDKDFYLKRLKVLRILIAVLVISLLVLVASSLWLVYLHVKLRSDIIDGYQEFSCSKSDEICTGLLCPTGDKFSSMNIFYSKLVSGTVWSDGHAECLYPSNYECCLNDEDIFLCSDDISSQTCVKVATNGVVLSDYKQMCREGYIWVPWRRRCFKHRQFG